MFVMVFVLNQHGRPLMPCSPNKAGVLLRQKKAKVVRRAPFTIQFFNGSSGYRQPLTHGMDTGFKTVGVSVLSLTKEVFSAEANLRSDVSKRVTDRRMYRRKRRNRLRYRKSRFLNRRKNIVLTPSVLNKVEEHLRIERLIRSILPITKTIIEAAKFNPHKLKNSTVEGEGYQKGDRFGYENVKAFVLARDSHRCQAGRRGCSEKLHVHHIIWRSRGGSDVPDNLLTLCKKHHDELHDGKFTLKVLKPKSYRAATVMNVIRGQLLKRLPEATETFGHITKVGRRELGLGKSHRNDAFVISGGTDQQRAVPWEFMFKRKNNRSLQKNRKGYKRSIRRQRYSIQPYDLVKWEGRLCRTKGTQGYGKYLALAVDGKTVVKRVDSVEVVFHEKTLMKTA